MRVKNRDFAGVLRSSASVVDSSFEVKCFVNDRVSVNPVAGVFNLNPFNSTYLFWLSNLARNYSKFALHHISIEIETVGLPVVSTGVSPVLFYSFGKSPHNVSDVYSKSDLLTNGYSLELFGAINTFVIPLRLQWDKESYFVATSQEICDFPLGVVGSDPSYFICGCLRFACAIPAVLSARDLANVYIRYDCSFSTSVSPNLNFTNDLVVQDVTAQNVTCGGVVCNGNELVSGELTVVGEIHTGSALRSGAVSCSGSGSFAGDLTVLGTLSSHNTLNGNTLNVSTINTSSIVIDGISSLDTGVVYGQNSLICNTDISNYPKHINTGGINIDNLCYLDTIVVASGVRLIGSTDIDIGSHDLYCNNVHGNVNVVNSTTSTLTVTGDSYFAGAVACSGNVNSNSLSSVTNVTVGNTVFASSVNLGGGVFTLDTRQFDNLHYAQVVCADVDFSGSVHISGASYVASETITTDLMVGGTSQFLTGIKGPTNYPLVCYSDISMPTGNISCHNINASGVTSITGALTIGGDCRVAGNLYIGGNYFRYSPMSDVYGSGAYAFSGLVRTYTGAVPTIGAGAIFNYSYGIMGNMMTIMCNYSSTAAGTNGSANTFYFLVPGGFAIDTNQVKLQSPLPSVLGSAQYTATVLGKAWVAAWSATVTYDCHVVGTTIPTVVGSPLFSASNNCLCIFINEVDNLGGSSNYKWYGGDFYGLSLPIMNMGFSVSFPIV